MSSGRFSGRLVLITGAGGDIGRASCLRLASEGASIFAVDRDPTALESTIEAVRGVGGVGAGVLADVTDGADCARYAAAAAEVGEGHIDMLFNNAGIEGPIGPIEELDDEHFDALFAVNVRGVFLGMKHVIPYMPDGAAIVNAGSTGSLAGFAQTAAYAASKHAVLGLTRSVAKEVAHRGIRVNATCPGPVQGRMITAIEQALGSDQAAVHAGFEASIPLGRFGLPEEVAAAVAFLFSDDAKYITGSALSVDGASL